MRDITDYTGLSSDVLRAKIAAVRAKAGDRLAILAHYYVPDEVVEIADYVGDSLGLAKKAAASPADTVLFCGVKFMLGKLYELLRDSTALDTAPLKKLVEGA